MPAVLVKEYCPTYYVEADYCRHWYEAAQMRRSRLYLRNDDERTGIISGSLPVTRSRSAAVSCQYICLCAHSFFCLLIFRNEGLTVCLILVCHLMDITHVF